MSNTQKQAVITLIEKKGKDRCFIENWRPISLLNVDGKIMSKVIATRIKNVFQILFITIKADMSKTDTSVKQCDLYMISWTLQIERIFSSGLLILIDFQKVFDTLEWDFLFKCLHCFNFGQDFIHWVKVFLSKYSKLRNK